MPPEATKPSTRMNIFLKGEAVSTFWNFFTKGIGLINTFLTISSLTLYQYGVFQLLLSFAGLPSDVLNLGSGVVSNEMSRAVNEGRHADAKKIFIEYSLIRITLVIILWLIVFFGSPYIFSGYSIDFVKDMRIISFLFLSEGAFMIIKTLCLVRLEFSIVALRSTLNKFVQLTILIYFFTQGDLGLKQLLWSIIIASSISVLLISFKFFKVYSKWDSIKIPTGILLWNIFIKYGTWDILRQFNNKLTFRVKPWLVKIFAGTEAVAIFSIAELIVTSLQDILPNNTLQSLVPSWIKDKNLSTKMFSYGVKYFMLLGLIIGLVALAIVPPVIHTFFSKYNESIPLFYLMITNLPIFAAGIIIGNYIIAFRKQKYLFFLHLSRSILTLSIILATLPFIGLWGLALEFVLVPLVMVCINYIHTRRQDKGFYFDFKIIFSFRSEDKEIIRNVISIIRVWWRKLIPSTN